VEELDDLLGSTRHPCRQGVFRVAAEVEQPGCLVPEAQNVFHDLGIVPTAGVRAVIRGTRCPRFVESAAQSRRFRIRDDRNIGRLVEGENPAFDAFLVCASPCLFDEHLVQATQLLAVGDVIRPPVRGVEHVLFELRLQLGELQHHRLEALFALDRQADTGEPEITQRVLDDLALYRRECGSFLLGNRSIGPVERFALRKIRLVRRQQRETGVVARPQRVGIQHCVQVAHGRPGARDLVLQLFEGLDDRGEGRLPERLQLTDPGAAALQELAYARLDVLGPN